MKRRYFAPGRVNLIGDHTDYSGGLVLPAAIDRGISIEIEPAEQIDLTSSADPVLVTVAADGSGPQVKGWGRYAGAVAAELDALGRPPVGLRGHLTSDLPLGAGLSSSAALEVVIAIALCDVAGFSIDNLALAGACQRAEHRAVGVPSGIMDQAVSLLGSSGHAVLMNCGTLEHRLIPLPANLDLLIVDSGVKRRLEDSGYASRRAQLEAGIDALGGRALTTFDEDQIEDIIEPLEEVGRRRVRHVILENARVRKTVDALTSPRGVDIGAIRKLFEASHASLRDDFEVTVPETDLLVNLCLEAGAVAARMTGGGFGGAVVALIDPEQAERVARQVLDEYHARQPRWKGAAFHCQAGDGAGRR